jgi:hypothetical protein
MNRQNDFAGIFSHYFISCTAHFERGGRQENPTRL